MNMTKDEITIVENINYKTTVKVSDHKSYLEVFRYNLDFETGKWLEVKRFIINRFEVEGMLRVLNG